MAVPARHRILVQSPRNKCFSPEERSQAVRELCNRRGTARKVAQSIGVSVPVLYKWKKDLISDEAYGRCEQVPDMRSSYSSGAHPRGTS
ncbi:transposase [Klebsiella pneumoniae]|nr:transposase [Klebsiella pneumoniae]MDR4766829.1 transposase [Klebsiella pneumoniae]